MIILRSHFYFEIDSSASSIATSDMYTQAFWLPKSNSTLKHLSTITVMDEELETIIMPALGNKLKCSAMHYAQCHRLINKLKMTMYAIVY